VAVERKVARVIAPGKRIVFLRVILDVTFELIDVRESLQVPARPGRESGAVLAVVDEGNRGLMYIDGWLVRELRAGTFAF